MPLFYQRQKEIIEALKAQFDKSLELDSNNGANSYEELIEKANEELFELRNNLVKNK